MKNKIMYLYVNRKRIPVSEEVYREYWRSVEREKYLNKKTQQNCIYIDSLFYEYQKDSLEYAANQLREENENNCNQELLAKLSIIINSLPNDDKSLINALYFEGISQRKYAKRIGISQKNVHKKHRKIVSFLRGRLLE